MRQLRITVEYDGTDLAGWQRQANAPSVQGHLEAALQRLLGHAVRVSGASRTDAGVHARGQVAAFSTERTIPADGIRRAVNAELPDSIAVVDAVEVDPSFHPRFSATGKHYRYMFWVNRDRSPRWARRAWHRPRPLELAAMIEAANHLVGHHDFSAFRAVGCASKSAHRRMDELSLTWLEPSLLALDVRGNAFLRNMMRIIAGTLAEVGEGRRSPAQVAELLASRDRRRGGATAPPHGLELMAVSYDGIRGEHWARLQAAALARAADGEVAGEAAGDSGRDAAGDLAARGPAPRDSTDAQDAQDGAQDDDDDDE